jgi:DNA-directed RNA polymerase specialized sigma24 family protein
MVRVDHALRPASEVDRLEKGELVYAVLCRVKPKIQAAALFYYVDEMSLQEASAAAQCSVPTFRKRLQAFVASARKVLGAQAAGVLPLA